MKQISTTKMRAASAGGPAHLADECEASSQSQSHILPLEGTEWGLWRLVGLRGAGFAAKDVLKLSDSRCAGVADELNEAEAKANAAREGALKGLWGEAQKADEIGRAKLVKAQRAIRQGGVPQALEAGKESDELIERLGQAEGELDRVREWMLQEMEASNRRISEAIKEVAGDGRMREAVVWQNRQALHGSFDGLLRMDIADSQRGAERRRREQLVASYLQRYCTKNDTIGFFGPVGWAKLDANVEAMNVRPGRSLTATREVYFEGWCIDTLAEKLSLLKAIRPFIAPRLFPFVGIGDTDIEIPFEVPIKLTKQHLEVLKHCNGERLACEIAAQMEEAASSDSDVYGLLEEMKGWGLISWKYELPAEAHPELRLRQMISGIGEDRLRVGALRALDELERGREGVSRAAGDWRKLDEAMEVLDRSFSRITGESATRSRGAMYAARTLVYEDCRRDIEVEIGKRVITAMSGGLELMLESARWYTYEYAKASRSVLDRVYREEVAKSGNRVVDGGRYWIEAQRRLLGDAAGNGKGLEEELQRKWEGLLNPEWDKKEQRYSSDQLRAEVKREFPAPEAGWQVARYHSPDLMIAAGSLDAIRRGDFTLVLGEMHISLNTLSSAFFINQHPNPEEIFNAFEIDLPEPRLIPATVKGVIGQTSRTLPRMNTAKDYHLESSHDAVSPFRSNALAMSELVVEDLGNGLTVRTRDGRLKFDIIETLSTLLSTDACNSFHIISKQQHVPRITIDNLVVQREAWHLSPQEMEFAFEKEAVKRFTSARKWAHGRLIPRFAFIKAPVEDKPVYVDFDSPVYVELLAKIVRRSKREGDGKVSVSEMLPTTEQVWLPDRNGNLYTSELRIVALDLKRPATSCGRRH